MNGAALMTYIAVTLAGGGFLIIGHVVPGLTALLGSSAALFARGIALIFRHRLPMLTHGIAVQAAFLGRLLARFPALGLAHAVARGPALLPERGTFLFAERLHVGAAFLRGHLLEVVGSLCDAVKRHEGKSEQGGGQANVVHHGLLGMLCCLFNAGTRVGVDSDLWKTTPMRLLRLAGALVLVLTLAAACAARPELVARSGLVPAGIDLSGRWQLRGEMQVPATHEPGVRIVSDSKRRRSSRNRDEGVAVRVFLEMGASLKVTQTAHGLFVSFDRAIVEEFTFGEKRIVAVGPIEAQRVSGWEGDRFIVETMDRDGALLTESWRLGDGAATLVRDIAVTRGDREEFSVRQVFDRE